MKKKQRRSQEINASSMADIAFLLLIFFLVTTQISTDKGLSILLPPKREKDALNEVKLNDRNVFKILVNSRNQLLVEDEPMNINNLRDETKKFINNNGRIKELSDNPKEAVVSYKTDRGTRYSIYVRVLDEIKAAYNELRAEYIGLKLQDYLAFDEKKSFDDPILVKKVKMYSQAIKDNVSVKEFVSFNPETNTDKRKFDAWNRARAAGKLTLAEKYFDASREFPLRISEAEPTKIGG